jgi:hypothetical protein
VRRSLWLPIALAAVLMLLVVAAELGVTGAAHQPSPARNAAGPGRRPRHLGWRSSVARQPGRELSGLASLPERPALRLLDRYERCSLAGLPPAARAITVMAGRAGAALALEALPFVPIMPGVLWFPGWIWSILLTLPLAMAVGVVGTAIRSGRPS